MKNRFYDWLTFCVVVIAAILAFTNLVSTLVFMSSRTETQATIRAIDSISSSASRLTVEYFNQYEQVTVDNVINKVDENFIRSHNLSAGETIGVAYGKYFRQRCYIQRMKEPGFAQATFWLLMVLIAAVVIFIYLQVLMNKHNEALVRIISKLLGSHAP